MRAHFERIATKPIQFQEATHDAPSKLELEQPAVEESLRQAVLGRAAFGRDYARLFAFRADAWRRLQALAHSLADKQATWAAHLPEEMAGHSTCISLPWRR